MCRSRRELSNAYFFAKIGVDTAENEPLKVWRKIQFIIRSAAYSVYVPLASVSTSRAATAFAASHDPQAPNAVLRIGPFVRARYGENKNERRKRGHQGCASVREARVRRTRQGDARQGKRFSLIFSFFLSLFSQLLCNATWKRMKKKRAAECTLDPSNEEMETCAQEIW